MRVALNGMLLSNCHSGVELSILRLAQALARQGSEEYRFYVPHSFNERLDASQRFETVRTGVPAHIRILRLLWEQLRLPRAARAHGCRLLHAPAYVCPRWPGLPVVLTVYDVMALSHPQWCRAANRWNYRLHLPASVRRAAAVIVPSAFTASELDSHVPGSREKIHVIPLAPAKTFAAAPDAEQLERVRQQHALPDRFLLSVCRQEPKKNIDMIVQAFHMLKTQDNIPHKLVLAGTRGWDCEGWERRIRESGLEADVLRTGFLTEADLAALYSRADVFVFPSLYEGFGLPPLEAMQCGTPVVCSNAAALPEVAGDAALLVDPSDPGALAQSIARLLSDNALKSTLSAKGREWASAFTWEKTARATERVYREVLDGATT